MEEQLQKAKELFVLYRGNFIHMHREGVLEAYKQFEVGRQVEIDWYSEMIDAYAKELSIRNWEAVSGLGALAKYYQDARIVDHVTAFISRQLMGADSIVKLMYAEKLLEIIQTTKNVIAKEKLYEAYRHALRVLEDIIAKPLIVDPGHELSLFQLKDKKSLNLRARKSIEEIKLVEF
ncbi:hypothetical protein [Paenibacillus aceris]|uniref:DUF309 domain-containing protein n=1 Tax=Paenibacillus aceris TaxID=869555 RepID=A0ABS4I1D5_9BACL|nr:hypothetical protein [Paenibacillus aceris]MBP1964376.1 hypothetical protein [Paenibacillus aceris]NHW35908.1 hypothetical protein [Paenibacillus aceris]